MDELEGRQRTTSDASDQHHVERTSFWHRGVEYFDDMIAGGTRASFNSAALQAELASLREAGVPDDALEKLEKRWVRKLALDPCPFKPIVPEDTDIVSRNEGDPMVRVLQKITLDCVLERYQIRRADWSPLDAVRREAEEDPREEFATRQATVTPTGSSSSNQGLWRTLQAPPKDKAAAKPTTPTPPSGAARVPGRPGGRKQLTTLRQTRGAVEQIADMPGAPDKDRPRAAAQAPSMKSIAERPLLE